MMDFTRFQEIIAPLGRICKIESDTPIDVYYERLKWTDDWTLGRAVEHLIDTHKYKTFPQPADFKEALEFIQSGSSTGTDADYARANKNDCQRCNGEGIRLAYVYDDGTEVEWERRNNDGVRALAKYCTCPYGQLIREAHANAARREGEKRNKRWIGTQKDWRSRAVAREDD